ncbi:MAG: alpha/beta hydrolase [Clostridiales bacterium]|jgi:acetyl esterase/lipase|nr:alpha/beta hydrolase [Clostridiales bacterium]
MKAKTVFKIIDASMDPVQNNGYKSFIKKNNISVVFDIVYDDKFPEIRAGDLYFKASSDSAGNSAESRLKPLLINIHGGGFVAGEKYHRRYFSAYIADIGYAVYNINYGVGPEYKFPFCLQSVAKAITWANENSEKYGFDMSKLVLSGDSAGASLAALGALTASREDFAKSADVEKPPVKPAAVLLYCGPYDIATALNSKVPLDLINKIMTDITGYDRTRISEFKYLNQFSPMDYIDANYPKAFLVYSQKDIFCKNHGEVFEKRLAEKGVRVSSFHSTSLLDNHCFHLNHNFKMAKKAMDRSKEFLLSI